jgi:hypothetical protein
VGASKWCGQMKEIEDVGNFRRIEVQVEEKGLV